jgi:hypothetical protein
MKEKLNVLKAVLAALLVITIGACTGPTLKGYQGPVLPDAQTAVIRSGTYTRIAACDGVKLSSPYLDIRVLPGSHILSIAFVERTIGNKLLYATQTASVAFVAKQDRTYIVYAEPVPESTSWHDLLVWDYNWMGYVTDATSGERVAQTQPLPLRAEHVFPIYGNGPS